MKTVCICLAGTCFWFYFCLRIIIWRKSHMEKWGEDICSETYKKVQTCACVNKTLRFLRCASGNCIGFESDTLQAAKLPIFVICPIEPPVDPLISLETEKWNNLLNLFNFCLRITTYNETNLMTFIFYLYTHTRNYIKNLSWEKNY